MAENLGDKLRKLRKEKKFTLQELADAAEMSKSYLWELENRDSRSPSAEKLSALASKLGVTTEYFFEDDINVPEETHKDEAFFRQYKNLDPDAKERLNDILQIFNKK